MTLAYYTGQSFQKAANFSTAVGCTDSILSATVGFNVTFSSTVTAATTYTYKIPYMKKIRIICTSDFKKYDVSYRTHYHYEDVSWDEYGSGFADGPLYNSTYGIELVSL